MGTAERIPLDREPLKATDPRDRAIIDYASQPPLGVRWYDPGAQTTTVAGVAKTLPFFGTAQFDPYSLISTADNSVKIPQPGIWDVHFEVRVVAAAGETNVYAQFGQGLTPSISDAIELIDGRPGMAAGSQTLRIDTPTYIDAAKLGAGDKWTISIASIGAATDFQLITFCLWLRSAVIPSRY